MKKTRQTKKGTKVETLTASQEFRCDFTSSDQLNQSTLEFWWPKSITIQNLQHLTRTSETSEIWACWHPRRCSRVSHPGIPRPTSFFAAAHLGVGDSWWLWHQGKPLLLRIIQVLRNLIISIRLLRCPQFASTSIIINQHQSASPTAFLLADRVGKALCGSALRQPWTNGGPVAHHANTPVPVAPAARKWMKWLRYDGGERIQTDPNSLNYPLVI